MITAFPKKKDLPVGRPFLIRDQGFEYAIRGSKTEKWRKTAKERGSDASPAVVTYSVTYFFAFQGQKLWTALLLKGRPHVAKNFPGVDSCIY